MAIAYRRESKAGPLPTVQISDSSIEELDRTVPVSIAPHPRPVPSTLATLALAAHLEEQSRYEEVEQLLNDLLAGTQVLSTRLRNAPFLLLSICDGLCL
jgi:hypothetical protein